MCTIAVCSTLQPHLKLQFLSQPLYSASPHVISMSLSFGSPLLIGILAVTGPLPTTEMPWLDPKPQAQSYWFLVGNKRIESLYNPSPYSPVRPSKKSSFIPICQGCLRLIHGAKESQRSRPLPCLKKSRAMGLWLLGWGYIWVKLGLYWGYIGIME